MYLRAQSVMRKGGIILKGEAIGAVQDIASYWEKGTAKRMINHIHYEVKTEAGKYVNPMEFLTPNFFGE